MKSLTTLVAIVAIFTCGIAYGDEPGPNYKHLKPMEWLIGTWVLEMEAPDDTPDDAPFVAKKGDSIRMILKFEWILSMNVIRTHYAMTVNDEMVFTAEGMIGWATDKKQIIDSGFDAYGGRRENVYTVVNEKAIKLGNRDASPDGEVTEGTTTLKLIDQDTFTAERTDITVGGAKKPDEPLLEFKRKKK